MQIIHIYNFTYICIPQKLKIEEKGKEQKENYYSILRIVFMKYLRYFTYYILTFESLWCSGRKKYTHGTNLHGTNFWRVEPSASICVLSGSIFLLHHRMAAGITWPDWAHALFQISHKFSSVNKRAPPSWWLFLITPQIPNLLGNFGY